MIRMWCDRCGKEVDESTNGGVRVRTGHRELALHLCSDHQKELRDVVTEFCTENAPREVTPSLPSSDTRKKRR